MELTLSFDSQGSSLAVWNDSAADDESRDGIWRWGGLNEAGGVVSGVGGLLWSFEDLMGGGLAELTAFPLGACLAGRAMLSREYEGGVGGKSRSVPLARLGEEPGE